MSEEKSPLKWKFKTNDNIYSPIVSEGIIYFGSGEFYPKFLYAVDSKSGKEKWSFETNGLIEYGEIAVSDRLVFFGTSDNYLHAIDRKTGTKKWKFDIGNNNYPPTAYLSPLILSEDIIYFASNTSRDKYLYAVDIKTGKEKWKFTKDDGFGSTNLAISEGIVYYANYTGESSDNYIYAVDSKSGKEKWKFEVDGRVQVKMISESVILEWRESSVEFGGDVINAVDNKTGKEKWKFKAGGCVSSSPAVYDGVVFFISSDNYIYAVDSETGKEKWKFKVADGVPSYPSVSEGMVYFANGNYLCALDIKLAEKCLSVKTKDKKVDFEQKQQEKYLTQDEAEDKGIKIIQKRSLLRAIWDKVVDDLSNQSYEEEVSHQNAWSFNRLEEDKYDAAIDDEPCPCGSGKNYEDCDGLEKVRIPSGGYIMEDEQFDEDFFSYFNTDELKSGILSKKEIEDWFDYCLTALCSSYGSINISPNDEPMYLYVDTMAYNLEDLNQNWKDDEYYLDDDKMEDFIKEEFSELGY